MLTDEGKVYIKRYLAGWVPAIGSSIAYGVGNSAENATNRKLQFEVGRADVTLTSYDFVEDKVVFKADLPDDLDAIIHEVALFSQDRNILAGDYGSRIISTFDSSSEDWLDPVTGEEASYTTSTARIGGDALSVTAPAGGTTSAVLEDILLDLSGNSGGDRFVIGYNVGSNVASIQIRFLTDSANYYSLTYNPTAGYRFNTTNKVAAVPSGAPDWENINAIEVRVTASSAGPATVNFDGIRIEDVDTPNPDYVMISRELLPTPFIKEAGRIQSIEFTLDVTI